MECTIKVLYICSAIKMHIKYMKVKQKVRDAILNDREKVMRLAIILDCGEANAVALLERNAVNGRLTTMQALSAISKITSIEISALLETEETVKA